MDRQGRLYKQRVMPRIATDNYTRVGAYFITTSVRRQLRVLATVRSSQLELTEAGRLVAAAWIAVADRTPCINRDAWVVMPNHFHAIVLLRTGCTVSVRNVVGQFKGLSARRVHDLWGQPPGQALWQRGFYEHLLRNAVAFDRVRQYILANPKRWVEAQLNASPTTPGRPRTATPRVRHLIANLPQLGEERLTLPLHQAIDIATLE